MTLLEQLPSAKEGSRELDWLIAEWLGWKRDRGVWAGPDGMYAGTPDWTRSIDSALTLVGEKMPGKETEILDRARMELGKEHALHIRHWKTEVDGSFTKSLALSIIKVLVLGTNDNQPT